MAFALARTRDEVPGAVAAVPPGGGRVLAAVDAHGGRACLRLVVAPTLEAVEIGTLDAPESVLARPVAAATEPVVPAPPPDLLQSPEGVLTAYTDGSGAGSGGWGVGECGHAPHPSHSSPCGSNICWARSRTCRGSAAPCRPQRCTERRGASAPRNGGAACKRDLVQMRRSSKSGGARCEGLVVLTSANENDRRQSITAVIMRHRDLS